MALNLQKLAHKRGADQLREQRANGASHPNGISEEEEYTQSDDDVLPDGAPSMEAAVLVRDYGSTSRSSSSTSLHEINLAPKKTLLSRLFRSKQERAVNGIASERTTLLPVDVITEEQAMGGRRPRRKPENLDLDSEDGNESDYLKSKVWCVVPIPIHVSGRSFL